MWCDTGYILRFNANLTVTDSGPNSLASLSQNVSFTTSGYRSHAISFNQNTSYFQINRLTGLGITNKHFSISLWIWPHSLSGTLLYMKDSGATLFWCLSFLEFAAKGSVVAQIWIGTLRTIFDPVLSTTSNWHDIVQTWSQSNGLRLYVNNNLVGTDASATSYVTSAMSNLPTDPSTYVHKEPLYLHFHTVVTLMMSAYSL